MRVLWEDKVDTAGFTLGVVGPGKAFQHLIEKGFSREDVKGRLDDLCPKIVLYKHSSGGGKSLSKAEGILTENLNYTLNGSSGRANPAGTGTSL